ncbi:hypothetical protein N8K70_15155 [Microbacterium betulae]|uniref:Uncharacterized protein n=1 Tax=Microbacterium betulae TaxID=2981139 RepID=A0AA97I6K3_9MICO|nr:hypothetical protein [Microbacterium sp. AB]WOF22712.1 hypothetical protein N8K70_15155 [Microbacterium sp. AB]
MSALTILGATGGVGATTVAALALHALGSRGSRLPVVMSVDRPALEARLGARITAPRYSTHEVGDGGRFAPADASETLENGFLCLVSAATPLGDAHASALLRRAKAEIGTASLERLVIVRNGATGPSRGRPDLPAWARRLDIPFDRALADHPDVTTASGSLSRRTRTAVAAWSQLVHRIVG